MEGGERQAGENESYITEHLALVDAPKCLHQACPSIVMMKQGGWPALRYCQTRRQAIWTSPPTRFHHRRLRLRVRAWSRTRRLLFRWLLMCQNFVMMKTNRTAQWRVIRPKDFTDPTACSSRYARGSQQDRAEHDRENPGGRP